MTAIETVVYYPVSGSGLSHSDANVIGRRMEYLKSNLAGGNVSPDIFVGDAQDESSPTHRFFIWDDKKAAAEHRRDRARYLLRSIEIVITSGEDKQERVRAFHSVIVKSDKEIIPRSVSARTATRDDRAYVTVADVAQNDGYRQQIVAEAVSYLRAWKRKYAQYEELLPVVAAIDQLIEDRRAASA